MAITTSGTRHCWLSQMLWYGSKSFETEQRASWSSGICWSYSLTGFKYLHNLRLNLYCLKLLVFLLIYNHRRFPFQHCISRHFQFHWLRPLKQLRIFICIYFVTWTRLQMSVKAPSILKSWSLSFSISSSDFLSLSQRKNLRWNRYANASFFNIFRMSIWSRTISFCNLYLAKSCSKTSRSKNLFLLSFFVSVCNISLKLALTTALCQIKRCFFQSDAIVLKQNTSGICWSDSLTGFK